MDQLGGSFSLLDVRVVGGLDQGSSHEVVRSWIYFEGRVSRTC